MAKHPDMQKIRVIEIFFENGQNWQLAVHNKVLRTAHRKNQQDATV
jgi:hypothetical protein